MEDTIRISRIQYEEYLELKKDRDEAIEQVDSNFHALKEGRVYNL